MFNKDEIRQINDIYKECKINVHKRGLSSFTKNDFLNWLAEKSLEDFD